MTFQEELQSLINRRNVEAASNTPDFILAQYISDCLNAFNRAVLRRERWYGFEMRPGMGDVVQRSDQGKGVPQP